MENTIYEHLGIFFKGRSKFLSLFTNNKNSPKTFEVRLKLEISPKSKWLYATLPG